MRYRQTNTMNDLTQDYASLLELIGKEGYSNLLLKIGTGLNNKGYVTTLDDIRFLLELQLPNIDLEYNNAGGQFTSVPRPPS